MENPLKGDRALIHTLELQKAKGQRSRLVNAVRNRSDVVSDCLQELVESNVNLAEKVNIIDVGRLIQSNCKTNQDISRVCNAVKSLEDLGLQICNQGNGGQANTRWNIAKKSKLWRQISDIQTIDEILGHLGFTEQSSLDVRIPETSEPDLEKVASVTVDLMLVARELESLISNRSSTGDTSTRAKEENPGQDYQKLLHPPRTTKSTSSENRKSLVYLNKHSKEEHVNNDSPSWTSKKERPEVPRKPWKDSSMSGDPLADPTSMADPTSPKEKSAVNGDGPFQNAGSDGEECAMCGVHKAIVMCKDCKNDRMSWLHCLPCDQSWHEHVRRRLHAKRESVTAENLAEVRKSTLFHTPKSKGPKTSPKPVITAPAFGQLAAGTTTRETAGAAVTNQPEKDRCTDRTSDEAKEQIVRRKNGMPHDESSSRGSIVVVPGKLSTRLISLEEGDDLNGVSTCVSSKDVSPSREIDVSPSRVTDGRAKVDLLQQKPQLGSNRPPVPAPRGSATGAIPKDIPRQRSPSQHTGHKDNSFFSNRSNAKQCIPVTPSDAMVFTNDLDKEDDLSKRKSRLENKLYDVDQRLLSVTTGQEAMSVKDRIKLMKEQEALQKYKCSLDKKIMKSSTSTMGKEITLKNGKRFSREDFLRTFSEEHMEGYSLALIPKVEAGEDFPRRKKKIRECGLCGID